MHYRREDDDNDERFDAESAAGRAAEHAEFLTDDDLERLERCIPEVARVLDAVAGIGNGAGSDPSWDGADCLAVVKGLEAVNRALESAQAQAVARLNRDVDLSAYGTSKLTSLLRSRLKITLHEARRRATAAANLAPRSGLTGAPIPTRYPRLAAGLATGVFSTDQVQAAIHEIEALPEPLRQEFGEQVEATLADVIAPLEVADIHAVGKRIRAYLDPDGKLDEPRYRREDLYLSVRQLKDGSWEIKGRVDAPTGLIINNMSTNRQKTLAEIVEAADGVTAAQVASESDDRTACPGQGELWDDEGMTAEADAFGLPADSNAIDVDGNPTKVRSFDHRSEGLRRHDRFAQLIRRAALAAPAGAAFALVVTATAEEFARGKGEVEASGGHLRLEDLQGLSPGGVFYYHSTRPGSKKVQVRSQGRFVTRRQLDLITARDRGCTFPGCDMPAGWCEAHHMVPWSEGGPTDVANLTLACSWHHHWHDTHGWRAELIDGLPAWIPPTYVDEDQTPLFHSRFLAQRAAITGILESPGAPGAGEAGTAVANGRTLDHERIDSRNTDGGNADGLEDTWDFSDRPFDGPSPRDIWGNPEDDEPPF